MRDSKEHDLVAFRSLAIFLVCLLSCTALAVWQFASASVAVSTHNSGSVPNILTLGLGESDPSLKKSPTNLESVNVVTPTAIPVAPTVALTPIPTLTSTLDLDDSPHTNIYVPPTPQASDDYTFVIDPLTIPNTNSEKAAAQLVISGTVAQIDAARWTTSSGNRPSNPFATSNTDYIFTPVKITIATLYKGSYLSSSIWVMALSGTVGQDSITWSTSLHDFAVGDHVLVFVDRPNEFMPLQTYNGANLWELIQHYTLSSLGTASNSERTLPTQQLVSEITGSD